jgi:hypothetical protein
MNSLNDRRRESSERQRSEFLDAYDQAIAILRSTFSPKDHHLIADMLSAYRDVLARDARLRAHIDRGHELHRREIMDVFREAQTANRRK